MKKDMKETSNTKIVINDCPFSVCDGKGKLIENPWGKYVECKKCGANGPQHPVDELTQIVIDSWNKR